ncbi:hypothetical protein UFOVP787_222 [uncultured Caudovirales phage]|uniref:Uncharacterized protein n=1 Tax=uncultured Caudovirales phage TaxID=2100421 RepID=A0A6J5NW30_9CAUD|nr:hypothetical protein UFOVP787_222 [uncultured Caudovirales phage]
MSWKSGTRIFGGIIEALNEANVSDDTRKKIYENLWEVFEDADFDSWQDLFGEDDIFDALYNEKYGHEDYFEEEDQSGC